MPEGRLDEIKQSVIDGELEDTVEATEAALNRGVPAAEILGVMGEAMQVVGEKYSAHQYFLPDMILAAEAMKAGLGIVTPRLESERSDQSQRPARIIIGTVAGDVHDIGKSIVQSMLVGAGFEVIDLGVDVSAEKFVAKVKELHPDIVAASAYMATSSLGLQRVNQALEEAGLRDRVRYIIGGAATNPGLVEWAKADGYAEDGHEAAVLAKQLLESR